MDNRIVRLILGLVAGVIVAGIVVALVEGAGHMIWPPPEGLDPTNPEDAAQIMLVIPTAAKVAVVIAWFLGALAGAWVAIAISKNVLTGWMVGLLMIVGGIVTTQMFPHPLWMVISAVVLPLLGVLLAKELHKKRGTLTGQSTG